MQLEDFSFPPNKFFHFKKLDSTASIQESLLGLFLREGIEQHSTEQLIFNNCRERWSDARLISCLLRSIWGDCRCNEVSASTRCTSGIRESGKRSRKQSVRSTATPTPLGSFLYHSSCSAGFKKWKWLCFLEKVPFIWGVSEQWS